MKIHFEVNFLVLIIILQISTESTCDEPQHYDPNVQKILKCIQQSEATPDDLRIAEMPANKSDEYAQERILCFFKCLSEETRLIIHGRIHPENLLFFPLTPPNGDQKNFDTAQDCVKQVSLTLIVNTCRDFERVLTCIRLMFGSVNAEQKVITDVKDEHVPKEIKSQLEERNKNMTLSQLQF